MAAELNISEFIEQLQKETDRGAALLGYVFFENVLLKSIEAFIIDRKHPKDLKSAYRGFNNRLQIAYALGLIDDTEYANIIIIKNIRNKFAHGFNPCRSFQDNDIIVLCKKFEPFHQLPEQYKVEDDARFFFHLTVSRLLVEMIRREDQIKNERILYKDRVLRISGIPKKK